jgi:hypothetical protein
MCSWINMTVKEIKIFGEIVEASIHILLATKIPQ